MSSGGKAVQPIRDKIDIEAMKNQLKKNGSRDYMLFYVGINTGLRIGDILKLKVSDVKDKTHIVIAEEKTLKEKRAYINEQFRSEIDGYIMGLCKEDYLFPSRKGHKAISRIQAYRILSGAAAAVGLEEIGTHTMRKTFGYWHYQQFKDIAILQDMFNHSSASVTLRYIGINQDMKDATLKNFNL